MNKVVCVLVICLLSVACTRYNSSIVMIHSESDTINVGEIFSAKLYVPHNDSILPSFFIIRNQDTFHLPVDELKRHGIFNAVGRGSGEMTYNGYVEYVNTKGEDQKEVFTIRFYVKALK